jgi:hypothetical protein
VNALVAVYVKFFFNQAGQIHNIVHPICIWLDPYSRKISYVVDILFLLLVMRLLLEEGREVVRFGRLYGGWKGIRSYFSSFKNLVDWICIIYSIVIFAMFGHYYFLVLEVGDFLLSADDSIPGSWRDVEGIHTAPNADFWEAVDYFAGYDQTMQNAFSFYPLVLGIRFFSVFNSQPRLGVVTSTLWEAGIDLVHFGIVLTVTIVVFCASGNFLFGRNLTEYQTFGRTLIAVFRGMLGDIDYVELTEVGRGAVNVWFVTFIIIVNLIMLNMVLAIVMEHYANAKFSMEELEGGSPTLWEQTAQVFRRWNQKRLKERMSINQIVAKLENNAVEQRAQLREKRVSVQISNRSEGSQSSENQAPRSSNLDALNWDVSDTGMLFANDPEANHCLTVIDFMDNVEGLNVEQAERLLCKCIHYLKMEKIERATLEVCHSKTRALELRMMQVQEVCEHMAHTMHQIEALPDTIDNFQRRMNDIGTNAISRSRPPNNFEVPTVDV